MADTQLGTVCVTPKGEYDATVTYQKLDIVRYESAAYIVKRECKGVTPVDGDDYMLLAAGGGSSSDPLEIYPVGIVLPFWNDTEPAAIFGGTWELIAEGQTLLQSGGTYTLGSTGGEANVTLTVETIPSHTHPYRLATKETTASNNIYPCGVASWSEHTVDSQITTRERGGGLPHNNLPPYLAVNLWKRTA